MPCSILGFVSPSELLDPIIYHYMVSPDTRCADFQLLGFSACSALTIYYLQQDTQTASALLLGSVEELHQGTGKVRLLCEQHQ